VFSLNLQPHAYLKAEQVLLSLKLVGGTYFTSWKITKYSGFPLGLTHGRIQKNAKMTIPVGRSL
jgi:hypothetical protein